MSDTGVIVLDVETTGYSPHRGDRIIEIGTVIIGGGEIAGEFHSLVSVPRAIPRRASQVNGITDRMLEGQPRTEEVYPAFRDFIGGATLVAHNA
jgi:DNA polymerase III epsilon subunit family exonuclease